MSNEIGDKNDVTELGGIAIIGSVDTDHTLITDPPHELRDQESSYDFDTPSPTLQGTQKPQIETCPSFAILHGVYGSDINSKAQRIEVVTDNCYSYTSFPQRLPLEEIVRREVFSLCGASYKPYFTLNDSNYHTHTHPTHPTRYRMTPARREGMTVWSSRETDEVNGLLRGLKWRSYIGSLSTDCRSWAAEVTLQRTEYSRWRSKYLFDPKNRRTGSPAPSPSLAPAQCVHPHGVPELLLAPEAAPIDGGVGGGAQDSASEELAYVEHAEQQKEINEDVVRTYSDHEFFARQDIRDIMNRVLMVYSRRHTDLSYVQGMNEILAPIVYALASDYEQVRALTAEESSVDVATLTDANIADLTPEDVRAIISEVVRVDYIEHDAYWLFTCLMRVIGPWFNSPKHPVPLSFISSPSQPSRQNQQSQQIPQQTHQSQLSQQISQQSQQSQLSQQLQSSPSPTLLSTSPMKPTTSVSPFSSPVKISQHSAPVPVPVPSGADSSNPSSVGSVTLLARFSGRNGPFGTPHDQSTISNTNGNSGNASRRNSECSSGADDDGDERENEIEVVAKCREIQCLLAEKDPELERSLRELGIQPQLYMLRWVRILFSQVFPLDDLLSIWDAIFACGAPFRLVDHFCVAMLTLIRKSIIGGVYSNAMNALFHYPLALYPTSMIVSIALGSLRSGTRPYYREAYLPPPTAPLKFPDLILDADAASQQQQQQQLPRGATLVPQSSNSVIRRVVLRKVPKGSLGEDGSAYLRERSSGPVFVNSENQQKEKEKEKEREKDKDSFQSKKESLQNFFGGLLKKAPKQEYRKHPTQEQMDELTKMIVSLRYEKLHYTDVFDQVEGKLDKLALLMGMLKEMVADEAVLDVVHQAESEVEDIRRIVTTQAPQHLAPFASKLPSLQPPPSPHQQHQQQQQGASFTSLSSLSPPGLQEPSPPLP